MSLENEITMAVENIVCRILEGVHTSVPAVVKSYKDGFADVEPVLSLSLYDGRTIKMPVVYKVPVIFPRTASFGLTFPVRAGDGVLLMFCERAIDEWIKSGEDCVQSDPRMFSLTDAVAIVGLFGGSKGTKPESESDVELNFGKSKMVMKEDGTIILNGGALEVKP